MLLLRDNQTLITTNNHVTAYIDGNAKFADLIRDISDCP